MTFANVCANREQLTSLSQLLLSAFPGCVIHQSCDPTRTIPQLATRKLDAVFVDADTHSEVIQLLDRQKAKASVYLLCQYDSLTPEKMGDVPNVITYPITKQKIQGALQTVPREIKEVI